MKKTPFILLKITLFLLTAIFFIGHNYVHAEEMPVRERLISVDKKDQDFTQALEAIANQAGIAINIHGQIPEGKRDLSMDQMPLGEAISKIMRLYGVQNHAAAYDPESKTIMLAVLGSGTYVVSLSPDKTEVVQTTLAEVQQVIEDYNRKYQDPASIEVLPPEKPGEKGTTLAEVQQIIEDYDRKYQDPNHVEVLPPDRLGEKGTTLAEVQQIIEDHNHRNQDSHYIEVLPPESPNENGTNLAEIESIIDRYNQHNQDPNHIEVLPPERSGEQGTTLAEVQQIIDEHNHRNQDPDLIFLLP